MNTQYIQLYTGIITFKKNYVYRGVIVYFQIVSIYSFSSRSFSRVCNIYVTYRFNYVVSTFYTVIFDFNPFAVIICSYFYRRDRQVHNVLATLRIREKSNVGKVCFFFAISKLPEITRNVAYFVGSSSITITYSSYYFVLNDTVRYDAKNVLDNDKSRRNQQRRFNLVLYLAFVKSRVCNGEIVKIVQPSVQPAV